MGLGLFFQRNFHIRSQYIAKRISAGINSPFTNYFRDDGGIENTTNLPFSRVLSDRFLVSLQVRFQIRSKASVPSILGNVWLILIEDLSVDYTIDFIYVDGAFSSLHGQSCC